MKKYLIKYWYWHEYTAWDGYIEKERVEDSVIIKESTPEEAFAQFKRIKKKPIWLIDIHEI